VKKFDSIIKDKSGLILEKRIPKVSIIGNPNSGKTAIFNRLTGLHHKIGNFPGVTVEKKSGWLKGHKIIVEDFPGTYSMNAQSMDEHIVSEFIQSWRQKKNRPDAVVVVVDATNLARNIFFALQIMDWGLPTILVLNMIDEVQKNNLVVDDRLLQSRLNVEAVIPVSAKFGRGIKDLIGSIHSVIDGSQRSVQIPLFLKLDDRHTPLQEIVDYFSNIRHDDHTILPLIDSIRVISDDAYLKFLGPNLNSDQLKTVKSLIKKTREAFHANGVNYHTLESSARYQFIDEDLSPAFSSSTEADKTISEKIDQTLTHPVIGSLIFIVLLGLIFNTIFSWAQYPMDLITSGIDMFTAQVNSLLPPSALKSLLVDGVISGVGNVIVFLPQIILLVFFIGLLEDSGYMARMSFMMDGLMGRLGMSGKSVLPLLSGFACAIPAVMAARTIESWKDRLLIIMLIPLMSCSARLPVYTLIISALIPQKTILGFIQLQGLILLGVYFLGLITALIIAFVIKLSSKKAKRSQYIIELPPYRIPMLKSLWWRIFDAGKKFIFTAGSIILAMTVILWFLASYPKSNGSDNMQSQDQKVSQSYAEQMGHLIEPVIKPLGFDWKIGVGLITSFAAREVIISTFSVLYNIEAGAEEEVVSLSVALKNDQYPDGSKVFTPLVAMSLLVFFVYAAQCMSTFAIIKRETRSWLWPSLMIVYMNILAYTASLIVFQGGKMIGLE
jgi:ferrous iron transport protein B